ncbi:putative alpha/beta hydrolase [Saccharata proteae CBS 121410]|uniref:Alpha/beta hydrolase n=1 Tax=Saccharata proteae CBS 121410 TaxID=1314787 RepID=A0A9P4HZL4_9PEZI|nr:putative alpha/beta hydrolase [Saccharata proteae CBS 121410]
MAPQTLRVPHLGGIDVGYEMPFPYDSKKPTCVLVNSMCMTTDLYRVQFENKALTDRVNLLAIEPLGHGSTTSVSEHFTYWDSAAMNIQVMDALGIKKAFTIGTSQGGWVVMRMALLAPDRIEGVIPLGTSMDFESEASRSMGCWEPNAILSPFVQKWSSLTATPEWIVDDEWCGMVGAFGFGDHATEATSAFWTQTLKTVYQGDLGRKKARMAVICLLERDGLHLRLQDIKCPVYWLQGSKDMPFGTELPKEEIRLFTNSPEAKLEIVEGGAHYLNATNPKEVESALIAMVEKYHKS